jgi:KUP system potassium uptake protein
MTYYLKIRKKQPLPVIAAFLFTYMTIEGVFLVANLHKFRRGGWFTVLMAGLIFSVMFVWYKGREIKKRFTQFINISDYYQVMKDLQSDISVPKYATHLIYLTRADNRNHIESKIIYSIINKQPKRADKYWFIHIHYVDDPDTAEYSVETLIPGVLIRVEFRLGFKINPRINLFFRQVVENMVNNKEIDIMSHYPSLRKHKIPGDFRFVIIDRIQTYDFDFSPREQMIMDIYAAVRKIGISDVKALGLDTSNVTVETVPLNVKPRDQVRLKRI